MCCSVGLEKRGALCFLTLLAVLVLLVCPRQRRRWRAWLVRPLPRLAVRWRSVVPWAQTPPLFWAFCLLAVPRRRCRCSLLARRTAPGFLRRKRRSGVRSLLRVVVLCPGWLVGRWRFPPLAVWWGVLLLLSVRRLRRRLLSFLLLCVLGRLPPLLLRLRGVCPSCFSWWGLRPPRCPCRPAVLGFGVRCPPRPVSVCRPAVCYGLSPPLRGLFCRLFGKCRPLVAAVVRLFCCTRPRQILKETSMQPQY